MSHTYSESPGRALSHGATQFMSYICKKMSKSRFRDPSEQGFLRFSELGSPDYIVKSAIFSVWVFLMISVHGNTLYAIAIHKNRSITPFLTTWSHFENRTKNLIRILQLLRTCHININIALSGFLPAMRRMQRFTRSSLPYRQLSSHHHHTTMVLICRVKTWLYLRYWRWPGKKAVYKSSNEAPWMNYLSSKASWMDDSSCKNFLSRRSWLILWGSSEKASWEKPVDKILQLSNQVKPGSKPRLRAEQSDFSKGPPRSFFFLCNKSQKHIVQ